MVLRVDVQSVSELERRRRTKWQNDDRKFFSRRFKIINAIKQCAAANGISEQTAAAMAQDRQASLGVSLAQLNEKVDLLFSR